MVKAERLYCLMQHIKRFGPIDSRNLALEFKLSVRTIYRDLRSLSKLGVPVQFETGKGYSIEFNKVIEFDEMDTKDAELLLFCLHNNPLNQSPYFRKRFKELNTSLKRKYEDMNGFQTNSFFHFDSSFEGLAQEYFEFIEKFIIALFNKNKVFLVEKRAFQKSPPLIPAGVLFKGNSAILALVDDEMKSQRHFEVEYLQGISLSNLRFREQPDFPKVSSRATVEVI